MPVKVDGKTFAYNDTAGITDAILMLANVTGNEAVAMSASSIGGCHLLVQNGNWFTNISKSSNAEFYDAFSGHDSAYNAAVKKSAAKANVIFAQICKERGLDEKGYPKTESTPQTTVAPTATPKPAETAAPVVTPAPTPKATPKPTAKPKATESLKTCANPSATAKPRTTQIPASASTAVNISNNTATTTPSPSVAPESSVSTTVGPVATPSSTSGVQAALQNNESEASASLNEQSAIDTPIVISASNIAETGEILTIELRTSELPEGTVSIKTPDGKIIQVGNTESTIQIKVNNSDLSSDGRIKVVTLDEERTPLGTYEIQAEIRPSSPGLLWLWVVIGIVVVVAAICTVIIFKKKQALKAE